MRRHCSSYAWPAAIAVGHRLPDRFDHESIVFGRPSLATGSLPGRERLVDILALPLDPREAVLGCRRRLEDWTPLAG
jgi:hypothetical protein